MVKYFVPRKQIRFTVFTQDKVNSDADSRLYGTASRKRKFVFKLNCTEQLNGNKCFLSIESVKCRDMSIIIPNKSHDENFDTTTSTSGITQRVVSLGNTDEKELYTIRANFISQSKHLDTRPQEYKTGGIIYNGSLNFNNTNPLSSYCYEVRPNVLNDDFILYIDSNFRDGNVDELGIKETLHVAVTFILWDGDEVEAIDGYSPDFNSLHISNRDRV